MQFGFEVLTIRFVVLLIWTPHQVAEFVRLPPVRHAIVRSLTTLATDSVDWRPSDSTVDQK
ncbi:MAG: hypothetical protein DWQ34_21790 [Planctomycetota bacterium]|nr:MAG: hypothetical protein DWQ34_21790 [Planctomycetota bacterium]